MANLIKIVFIVFTASLKHDLHLIICLQTLHIQDILRTVNICVTPRNLTDLTAQRNISLSVRSIISFLSFNAVNLYSPGTIYSPWFCLTMPDYWLSLYNNCTVHCTTQEGSTSDHLSPLAETWLTFCGKIWRPQLNNKLKIWNVENQSCHRRLNNIWYLNQH